MTTQSESPVAFLLARFSEAPGRPALLRGDQKTSYGELVQRIDRWREALRAAGVRAGAVVLLRGDFSADSVAALLALFDLRALVVPLSPTSYEKHSEFCEVAQVEWVVESLQTVSISATGRCADHPLLQPLRDAGEAGLVIFSSGSTGRSKGALHVVSRLLQKFHTRRQDLSTVAMLLFDHIAGFDTLFYCLSNTSLVLVPARRDPDGVCALIAAQGAEVLPTAPSFLNLILMSGAHQRHDLTSLKIITYGSEMMLQATLDRCTEAFPSAKLIQKYGTSEVGALQSRSRDDGSRWVRIGGEGFEWRVREGKLEIKAATAMAGYLNADSPFTDDGFFMTGDMVELDGDYLRFLGRDSDIINVGGQKVFPAEVEATIKELPEVADVAVFGEPSPILGAVVVCRVQPADAAVAPATLRAAIRNHLRGRVEGYKIPQKFQITDQPLSTSRFKQVRR